MDYSPNLKHHFDGFVYIARQTQTAVGTYQPYWGTLGIGSTAEYAGAWTYTPNSRWVNDLRGGAAPNSGNSVAQDAGVNPCGSRMAYHGPLTGFGFNSGFVSGFGMTCITVEGGDTTTASTGLGDCGKNGVRGPQYQLDFTDKVSYLRGNHAFKWGYEEVFVHFDDGSTANLNGTVAFGSLAEFLCRALQIHGKYHSLATTPTIIASAGMPPSSRIPGGSSGESYVDPRDTLGIYRIAALYCGPHGQLRPQSAGRSHPGGA